MIEHTAIGIDGCRDGWIAAIREPDSQIRWQFTESIRDFLGDFDKPMLALVDMIIGLPDARQSSRECDRLARKLLKPHGSRVFPAPPSEALHAADYRTACELARDGTGKAISKQCWYLFPKIRELDALNDPRIRESHPELVFAKLNRGTPVSESKKTPGGQKIRLDLLETALPRSIEAYQAAVDQLPKVRYLLDDCIDALALCVAARSPQSLTRLPTNPDLSGIWY